MNRLHITVSVLILAVVLVSACARSPQARRDKYFARGTALLEKKDYGRAILEFQNAVRALPGDTESYYQLGVAHLAVSDVRAGVLALRKALELNPKHRSAQLRMAELYSMTPDPTLLKDAQSRLKELLQDSPATPEILNTLGATEMKLGNLESAIQTYERVLAQSPGELTAIVMLARAKLLQKDAKGAEEVLKKAVADAPRSAAARRFMADFYIEQRRMGDAEAHLREALAIDSQNGPALMDLARLELTLGRRQEAEQSFKRLATLADFKPIFGIYLLDQGRLDEAVREFERLAAENPDDRAARLRLIVAYRRVKRPADAERVIAEALKKNSKDTDALIHRAEIAFEAAKYAEAEADLNRALKLKPTAAEVHYLLAKLHQQNRQPLRYRQELSEALRLNPTLVDVRVELAQDLIAAGDAKGAISLLDSAPEPQKRYSAVAEKRNWALWLTGDLPQMRQGVDRGLAAGRTPNLLVQDGLLKLRAGDAVGARAAAEEALKIDPSALLALRVLEKTYAAQKQLATGILRVKEYAKVQTNSAPTQHFLGMLLLGSGDRGGARTAFTAAKTADPAFRSADLALVQMDALDGKLDDARNRLQTVLTADGSHAVARNWLGNVEVMRGDFKAAMEQFRRTLDVDPGNAQAANNLAYLLMEHGNQVDEALKYAQKAVELAPDQPAFWDTLGWAFYQKRQYSAAIRYLERASASNQDPTWKYHLAMAYAKSGDLTRGRATLAAALKQNAKVPEAKLAREIVGLPK